jgi:ELWxxDGT repeat protein
MSTSMSRSPILPFACAALLLTVPLAAQNQPQMLGDLALGFRSSDPLAYVEYKGQLWFAAHQGSSSYGLLYRTDGTPAGTQVFQPPGAGGSYMPDSLVVSGGLLYFVRQTAASTRYKLHVTDGTVAGTRVLDPIAPGPWGGVGATTAIALRDGIVFVDQHQGRFGLYFTDGTTITLLAADVEDRSPFRLGNRVLFGIDLANAASNELWATDGTPQGTGPIATLNATGSAHVQNGREWQGRGYFQAAVNGEPQLFVNHGTLPGATQLTQLAGGVSVNGLTAAGSYLFFRGPNGLWRTDGTAAGTMQLPGALEQYQLLSDNLVAKDGLLWFIARTIGAGSELWRSDGTPAGTLRQTDLFPGPGAGVPEYTGVVIRNLFRVGSRHLWFVGDDGVNGRALWRTDGIAPPALVAELEPGAAHDAFTAFAIHYLGGRLVWSGGTQATGTEPWAMPMPGIAHPRGQGCGTPSRKPAHFSTDPVLGTTIGLEGQNGYPGAVGFVVLGFAAAVPLPVSPTCSVQLDLSSTFLMPPFQVVAGSWNVPLAIPNRAALTGLFLMSQTAFVGTDAPTGLEFSNGLELVLGN